MDDKLLLEEILKRLGDNFYDANKPYYHNGRLCALTNSEAAADALEETLFNIGLEDSYERFNGVNNKGIWEARFTAKECDNESMEESHKISIEYCETEKEYYVSYSGSSVVTALNEDEACERALNKLSIDDVNAYLMNKDGTINM